jgi:hypothetical protein
VSDAKLRQQGIYRPDLNSGTAANISEFGCLDVVFTIGRQQWHCRKSVQNQSPIPWPGKTLQQLLEDETGCHQGLAGLDGANEYADFRRFRWNVTPKRQRPNAGVNEQGQSRARSAL